MSVFDQYLELGRLLGMNEATARQFAIGRDGSEPVARANWAAYEAAEAADATQGETPLMRAMESVRVAAQEKLGMSHAAAQAHVVELAGRTTSGTREQVTEYLTTYAKALRGQA